MRPLEELLLLNWPDVHFNSSSALAFWENLLRDFMSSLLWLLSIRPSKMTPLKSTGLHKFDDLSSSLEPEVKGEPQLLNIVL